MNTPFPEQLNDSDLMLLSALRCNAREKLTIISRRTHVPVSTLHDKLKGFLGTYVTKHTTLLDFSRLGYQCHAQVLVNGPKETRQAMREFLAKHPNVNSAFKINNGYAFLLDVVFESLDALDAFLEQLDEKFGADETQTHYIIDELKREAFLTDLVRHQLPPAGNFPEKMRPDI